MALGSAAFFAEPDPAVFLSAYPDPALQNCGVIFILNLVKKSTGTVPVSYEEFAVIDPFLYDNWVSVLILNSIFFLF